MWAAKEAASNLAKFLPVKSRKKAGLQLAAGIFNFAGS